jgi:WD40 repeat protein
MSEPRLRDGRSWRFDAPVVACAFDSDGTAAFALGDGTLRTAAPRTGEPHAIEAHKGAVLALALHPQGGFISGGDDGRLVHTKPSAGTLELAHVKGRWIENVTASAQTGLIAFTAGKSAIILHGTESTALQHASTASGVAFDPKGRRLAVAHYDAASLWWAKAADQQPKKLQWKGSHLGVTWSPDGRFLVTTMQENALHGWRLEDAADMRMSGYPSKVKSFVWDRRGRMLFTSGSSRVIGWPFSGRGGPMGREPLELGPERDALVQVVAAHPKADIIAAGTSDGTVWLESIGDPGAEFLLLDGAKITALAFSPDGSHVALGAEDGYAAVVPVS